LNGILRFLFLFFAAGAAFFSMAATGNAQPADPRTTGNDLALLRRGEVLVRTSPDPTTTPEMIQASVLIGAPAEQIWTAMNDCDRAIRFVPGLKACRVVERNGEGEIIEHRLRYSRFFPEATYSFQVRYDLLKQVSFHRLSGDLKEFWGSWRLEPLDGGQKTVVTYSVYMDPGFFVPKWIIRFMLRRDLPDLMIALRDVVQAPAP
jgi:ribosome-associated toxin RatA of RatAB toxin-antitoxin module